MNRLNKQQLEYAKSRISRNVAKQKGELKESLTSGKELTDESRATLVRTGKVKFNKSITEIGCYTKARDCYDFTAYEQSFDKKKYHAECEKIDKEAEKLMDELVLGDTQKALELISKLK